MALSKVRLLRKLLGAKAAQSYLQFVKGEYPDAREKAPLRLREALRAAELVCRAKAASPLNEALDA